MTAFYFVLLVLFLLLVFVLTGVILLQEPKTGGLSSALGGGGAGIESFLGARGAPTFFMKATWVLGGLYMVLSLVLSLMSGRTVAGTTIEREIKSGELQKKLAPLTPGGMQAAPSQGQGQGQQSQPGGK